MLPQTLTFSIFRPKFNRLQPYRLKEVPGFRNGYAGNNPHTGQPLSFGVIAEIKRREYQNDTDFDHNDSHG
jgi:hypothetical protein